MFTGRGSAPKMGSLRIGPAPSPHPTPGVNQLVVTPSWVPQTASRVSSVDQRFRAKRQPPRRTPPPRPSLPRRRPNRRRRTNTKNITQTRSKSANPRCRLLVVLKPRPRYPRLPAPPAASKVAGPAGGAQSCRSNFGYLGLAGPATLGTAGELAALGSRAGFENNRARAAGMHQRI